MIRSLLTALGLLLVTVPVWAANSANNEAPSFLDLVDEEEPISASTAPKNRGSSVGAVFSTDGTSYSSGDLIAQVGIDENWLAKASGNVSSSTNAGSYGSADVGADVNFLEVWSFGFLLNYQKEPGAIYGRGFTLNADYIVSNLWNGSFDTTLSLGFSRLEYLSSQPVRIIAALAARRNLSAYQTNPTFTLSQELPLGFTLSLIGGFYNYSFDPVRLSQLVALRQTSVPGVEGLISGFPKKSYSLDLQWSALRMAYSQTLTAINSEWIRSATLGGTLSLDRIKNWEATAEVTHTLPSLWYSKVGLSYLW